MCSKVRFHLVLMVMCFAYRSFLELPEGSKPLSIDRCGSSYWTKGAEIVTEQSDGSKLSFFLKVRYLYRLITQHEQLT